jgi:hypothetical protein
MNNNGYKGTGTPQTNLIIGNRREERIDSNN